MWGRGLAEWGTMEKNQFSLLLTPTKTVLLVFDGWVHQHFQGWGKYKFSKNSSIES